jgi:hypothetical protein
MNEKQVHIMTGNGFDIRLKGGAIISLKYNRDIYDTDYIWEGRRFGDIFINYRKLEGNWNNISTMELAQTGKVQSSFNEKGTEYSATYIVKNECSREMTIEIIYSLEGNALSYKILITNNSSEPVEIGDLAIPFLMNSSFSWDKKSSESVIRHSFISGDNSYLFWMRCNGTGPYLVMTPCDDSKLEFFEMYKEKVPSNMTTNETMSVNRRLQYRAYIHSTVRGEVARQKGCNWRQSNTSIIL